MQRLAWQPRESKVADCPNGNNYSGRVERAGSPRERSSYQVIHGPQRGPPLQTRGPGPGVRAPTHRCRSPPPSSGSRARAQRAGNPSAAPGAVAMMQEASRLNGPASEVQAPLNASAAPGTAADFLAPGVERAGPSRERSSHQIIHGPRRGPPLPTRGPGSGVQAPTHRCRSPPPSSGSRVKSQRAGNPSAAPGAVAMMQEASRLDGSSERGPSSAELVGRSQDRNFLAPGAPRSGLSEAVTTPQKEHAASRTPTRVSSGFICNSAPGLEST
ncbi:hypothetical protein NDU88_004916 [Pleurodeles waltl]|uniref:Uncharacterized protein n=1 Tax=Pleurodeles waltl TaxID=8319 RepID=A0AAV7SK87_PLEWA|nr:hypothetical protein NDU88_004916 [Pleurodeles waltl]